MLFTTLLAAALTASSLTAVTATDIVLAEVRVGRSQARATALRACPGAVLSDGLVRVDARWVYAFEIRPIRVGADHIVRVDARTGDLVSDNPVWPRR